MAHALFDLFEAHAIVEPDQRRRVRQAVGRHAAPLDAGRLQVCVDAAADGTGVEPLALGPVPVGDEERLLGADAPPRVEVDADLFHDLWIDGHLLVFDGASLALDAQVPAQERLLQVLQVGPDDLDLAQPGVEHQVDDRHVSLADLRRGIDRLQELLDLRLGKHLPRVRRRTPVALDGHRRVLRQQPDIDEVLAEAPHGREVGGDGNLAEFARLHQVFLVGFNALGREAKAAFLLDEPAFELVERTAVGTHRLGALLLEIDVEEVVQPSLHVAQGKLE